MTYYKKILTLALLPESIIGLNGRSLGTKQKWPELKIFKALVFKRTFWQGDSNRLVRFGKKIGDEWQGVWVACPPNWGIENIYPDNLVRLG